MRQRKGGTPVFEVVGDTVVVKEGYEDFLKKGYGEEKEGYLVLSWYEALYLSEKGKLSLPQDFLEKIREEKVLERYHVYKDLRERGYVAKTGFKFGTHFRVYPRGKKPGEAHTRYVVQVVKEDEILTPENLARLVRVATTVRAELVLAFVDAEHDITYYKISRIGL